MIRGVLIDLSGTLHIEDLVVPGAISALTKLRSHGFAVKFLTNTTKESRNYLYNRLVSLGFGLEKQEIFTSLNAARTLIDQRNLRCHFIVDDKAMEDFEGVNTTDPNAVVIGLAPDKFEYDNMNAAFRLLLDGAELVAIHKARYYKTKDGLSVGPGAFVTALEYATRKEATVVGKPCKAFFQLGLNAIGSDIKPEETVMIGDDVNDDVIGAIEAGMRGILVRTGKYKKDDENKIPEDKRNCVDSFVEAVDHIVSQLVR